MTMRFLVFLVFMFMGQSIVADEKETKAIELPEIILGSPNAPHEIVMCFSPTCHHCAEFEEKFLPEVIKEFVDTGKVRFVIRLLTFYDLDFSIGKLTWSKGKEKFIELTKLFLNNQKEWLHPTDIKNEDEKKKLLEEKLTTVAEKLGMEKETLRQKMSIEIDDRTSFLKLFCLENGFTPEETLKALAENTEMEKALASTRMKTLDEKGEMLSYAPAFYMDVKLIDGWADVDTLNKMLKPGYTPIPTKTSKSEGLVSPPWGQTKREVTAEHKDDLQHQTPLGAAVAG